MFKRKPTVKGVMIDKGTKVKVSMTNTNTEQGVLILFVIIKEMAKAMGIDHRQLMNKVIDIDKKLVKNNKALEKKAKYQKAKK